MSRRLYMISPWNIFTFCSSANWRISFSTFTLKARMLAYLNKFFCLFFSKKRKKLLQNKKRVKTQNFNKKFLKTQKTSKPQKCAEYNFCFEKKLWRLFEHDTGSRDVLLAHVSQRHARHRDLLRTQVLQERLHRAKRRALHRDAVLVRDHFAQDVLELAFYLFLFEVLKKLGEIIIEIEVFINKICENLFNLDFNK